jgi:hypothetical protein
MAAIKANGAASMAAMEAKRLAAVHAEQAAGSTTSHATSIHVEEQGQPEGQMEQQQEEKVDLWSLCKCADLKRVSGYKCNADRVERWKAMIKCTITIDNPKFGNLHNGEGACTAHTHTLHMHQSRMCL